jgi:hypothetical protein
MAVVRCHARVSKPLEPDQSLALAHRASLRSAISHAAERRARTWLVLKEPHKYRIPKPQSDEVQQALLE